MDKDNKIVIIVFSAMSGFVAGLTIAILIAFLMGGKSEKQYAPKNEEVVLDNATPPPQEEQSQQTKAAIQVIRNTFSGNDKDGQTLNLDTSRVLSYKIVECKPINQNQDSFKVQLIIKEQYLGTPTSRLDFIMRYDKETGCYVIEDEEEKRIAVEEE